MKYKVKWSNKENTVEKIRKAGYVDDLFSANNLHGLLMKQIKISELLHYKIKALFKK